MHSSVIESSMEILGCLLPSGLPPCDGPKLPTSARSLMTRRLASSRVSVERLVALKRDNVLVRVQALPAALVVLVPPHEGDAASGRKVQRRAPGNSHCGLDA